MNIVSFLKGKKSRKYPVRYDELGRSLRQRAFELFDHDQRPMQVCKQLPIKVKTCLRYWADWKRSPPNLSQRHKFLRKALKNNTGLKEDILEALAKHFSVSRDEVIRRLQHPYGLKQALLGKWPALWPDEGIAEAEGRLREALTLIDFAKMDDESYKDLDDVLSQLMARKRRNKQSTQVDRAEGTHIERHSAPIGGIQKRPRLRFDIENISPQQWAAIELRFSRQKEAEDRQTYRALIGLTCYVA